MVTQEKCRALQHIESDRKFYLERLDQLSKLEAFIEGVPEEIKALGVTFEMDWNGTIKLFGIGEDTYKALKIVGAIGLGKKLSNDTNWKAEGSILLNDEVVKIILYPVEQPPNCRLEEYTETVTKYKAICEDTGKEIEPTKATIGAPSPA